MEIEAHGEIYLSLKYYKDGIHLAVKKESTFPNQEFLIKEEKEKEKK